MLLDRYNRIARLTPALITLLPAIWTVALIAPTALEKLCFSGALAIAGTTLMSNLARSQGKQAERRLLTVWGALPTTQLLRHRNPDIDAHTKARYHARLNALCVDLTMPSPQEESANPYAADALYASAVKHLLELRRGKQYSLLQTENAAYGFRRNLYGLKNVAWTVLGVSVAAAALTLRGTPGFHLALSLDAVFGLIFGLWINEIFVLEQGNDYARALFRTLDDGK